ncbi:hypothetical protein [Sphingomonas hankyongi]|uniref:Lipoprotein SmpA/OmlA domain-containing protein n=1 Tax=Sphingomonas hankyongi TaxID=2908209 RepID=A0ABT0S097_9SPHN|nr:hypothetical protein [Sphingomonas hankyongi]MCL6729284.1 hypothetical protein [Sphingomonas hankyongi]
MHVHQMRRLVPALSLFVAACATAPRTPEPASTSQSITPSREIRSNLIGMTASELVSHLGNPVLQVREGPGLKMQFRSRYCVLDAYLYPPESGTGLTRVSHSDARLPSGQDTDQAACISQIEATK